jgi:transposase-like protein
MNSRSQNTKASTKLKRNGDDEIMFGVKCPYCGSKKTIKNMFFLTESSKQYICENCDHGFNIYKTYRRQ